jgi:hypothetical protein
MRYVFFLVFCISIIGADAQVTWGVKMSVVVSELRNEKDYYDLPDFWDPKVGGAAGVFGRYAFDKRWSVQMDAGYCLAGANSQGGGDPLHVHYIPVPISIGFNAWEKWRFFAGPQFNMFLSASRDYDFKTVDIGANAGLEFRASSKLGLFVKSYYGLVYNERRDVFRSEILEIRPFKMNRNIIHEVGVYFYLPSKEDK